MWSDLSIATLHSVCLCRSWLAFLQPFKSSTSMSCILLMSSQHKSFSLSDVMLCQLKLRGLCLSEQDGCSLTTQMIVQIRWIECARRGRQIGVGDGLYASFVLFVYITVDMCKLECCSPAREYAALVIIVYFNASLCYIETEFYTC